MSREGCECELGGGGEGGGRAGQQLVSSYPSLGFCGDRCCMTRQVHTAYDRYKHIHVGLLYGQL